MVASAVPPWACACAAGQDWGLSFLWARGCLRLTECALARSDLLQHRVGRAAEPGDRRLHPGFAGQLAHIGHLGVVHQRHHGVVGSGAGGAPGPVHVGLVLDGRIGMHHQGHVVDVDATRGDVGGDQYRRRTVGKRGQIAGACVLGQVAVELDSGNAARVQLAGKIFRAVFGAGEDDLAAG